MEHRQLGRTGLTVSEIGYGAWGIGATGWVGAREDAIVETVERDALPPQLLLDPLVAVEAQLDRIREIRPKFDKRRAPVRILDVEVVVIDRDRLPGEVERHRRAPGG